jgi:proteasome lid subunit RPN8/RPN11
MPSPVSGAVGFVHSHPGRKISSTAMSEKDETAEKVLRLPFFVIACDDGLLIRCLDRNGNVKIELTTT